MTNLGSSYTPTHAPLPMTLTRQERKAHTPNSIKDLWRHRRCFVCGQFGFCRHREPDVEEAILEARAQRLEVAA